MKLGDRVKIKNEDLGEASDGSIYNGGSGWSGKIKKIEHIDGNYIKKKKKKRVVIEIEMDISDDENNEETILIQQNELFRSRSKSNAKLEDKKYETKKRFTSEGSIFHEKSWAGLALAFHITSSPLLVIPKHNGHIYEQDINVNDENEIKEEKSNYLINKKKIIQLIPKQIKLSVGSRRKSVRMQLKTPILPFGDYVALRLLPNRSEKNAIIYKPLNELAMAYLFDKEMARGASLHISPDSIFYTKLLSLWDIVQRRGILLYKLYHGKITSTHEHLNLPSLNRSSSTYSSTNRISFSPPLKSLDENDNNDNIKSPGFFSFTLTPAQKKKDTGELTQLKRKSLSLPTKLSPPKLHQSVSTNPDKQKEKKNEKDLSRVYFFKLFVRTLNDLSISYFCYHWEEINALIRANEKLGSTSVISKPRIKTKQITEKKISRGKELWQLLKKLYFRKRATELFKAQREFKTIGALLKIAQESNISDGLSAHDRELLTGDRAPIILFLGGGMGAGKSSLLTQILSWRFWRECSRHAVIIEADRIKMTDPIFQALSVIEKGDHSISSYVHAFSTSAANRLLLAAVQHGRDIIMDGTLTWLEYVKQTVNMIRNSHEKKYVQGPGYIVNDDGSIIENYWECVGDIPYSGIKRRPYRIQIVGVTCLAETAVARGIRRRLVTGRGVPITPQLRSHRLFATNFLQYVKLANECHLYDTSGQGRPVLIAKKTENDPLLVDPRRFRYFLALRYINVKARNSRELYIPQDDDHDTKNKLKNRKQWADDNDELELFYEDYEEQKLNIQVSELTTTKIPPELSKLLSNERIILPTRIQEY